MRTNKTEMCGPELEAMDDLMVEPDEMFAPEYPSGRWWERVLFSVAALVVVGAVVWFIEAVTT